MSVDENKAIARRFVTEHNQAAYMTTFDAILDPGCIMHEYLPGMPESMDREAYDQFIAAFRGAMPDIRDTAEDVLAEGDRVAVRWKGSGTHTGAPLMGIPAGNKKVAANGTYIFRITEGKIVEAWDFWDNLNVLQQLGALPPPPQQQKTAR